MAKPWEEQMRALFLTLILIALCSVATAEIGPFSLQAQGQFNGKLATYASGDTIIFANNTCPDPDEPGIIQFHYSTDGGVNWNVQEIASIDCLTQPTLMVSPGEFLISFTDGYHQRKLARSTDGGLQWQIIEAGRSFENSPVVEELGTEYRSFALDLPFPESDQGKYTIPGQSEEFICPEDLTLADNSAFAPRIYYSGQDVIHGMVRSNSDIWIKQIGGGSNYGWPTFYGPVITSGDIQSTSGVIPYQEVFRGGFIEFAPELEHEPLDLSSPQGQIIGPSEYDPNTIVMVTVDGNSYSGWVGQVTEPMIDQSYVYNPYPVFPLGDPLFENTYLVADTLWTPLAGNIINGACFTPNKLWIKGNFAGHQTWTSADTIMIIGDITLSGTYPGFAPDGEPLNTTDSVKLIAGKSVILKYGYRNPADSLRVHPLCRGDEDPIMIYASIYALHDDPINPFKDGCFTFEYQHPHPSVPTIHAAGQYWDKIDLHRRRYPQTFAEPWPGNVDFPWYNPLWPERQPYLERGEIALWGAVYQNRRGHIHRPAYDTEYPTGGVWNIEIDFCGATSAQNYTDPVLGIPMYTRNFPGATGSGIGYKKNYHDDDRFSLSDSAGLSSGGLWKLGMNISELSFTAEGVQFENLQRKKQYRKTHSKVYSRNGDLALYATNDLLLKSEGDSFTDLSHYATGAGNIYSVAMGSDGSAALYQLVENYDDYTLHFKRFNPEGILVFDGLMHASTMLNDLVQMPDGRLIYAIYAGNSQIDVWEISPGNESQLIDTWTVDVLALENQNLKPSRLYLVPTALGEMEVFLWLKSSYPGGYDLDGRVYHAHASFPVSNDDPAAPPVQNIRFSGYPNPMREELKLDLEIPANSSHRIEIYNIRGQKVTSFRDATDKTGTLSYVWNGRDTSGRACAPGIYLVKLFVNDRPIRSKRICRIGYSRKE